jgi:hypothetical protein
MTLQRALTGSSYAGLTQHKRIIAHFLLLLQIASSMVKNSESREREKERQGNHLLLIDMIGKLQEERILHSIPFGVSQSRERLPPVSLAWVYCVDV